MQDDDLIVFRPYGFQAGILKSKYPITLAATGIQAGKTTAGALWLKMLMHQYTDPLDNFIVVAPTYKILSQSTLPPILRYMDGYGTYHRQDSMFEMYGGGRCYFRTGTDPDSIVGITNVRGIYGDEAGLYSLYFWENIQARAAFKDAPILLTTSPYSLNWVYKDLIRPKQKASEARPDVLYLKARSIDNPFFPKDYYERMRTTMDDRRFRSMFGGEWEKMDGLVYNCFDEEQNSINPFNLPSGTKYVAGVDWGTTAPFVIVVRAITPTGDHFQVTEVYRTGQTIMDMIQLAKQKLQAYPIGIFYCDPSNPGYISEFNRAGIPAVGAQNDIKIGIDLHYALIKSRRYKLFRGDNKHTIDEYDTYHYPSPDEVKADTDIDDQLPVKQNDHACFAAGTPIKVPGGFKPIEQFLTGDLVSTPIGDFKVEDAWCTGIKEVQRYTFSDGSSFVATKDHPLYVRNKGFIALENITQNDTLPVWKDQKRYYLTARVILCGVGITDVLAAFSTAIFTNFLKAKSLMGSMYITSILIRLTTNLTIWLRYLLRSITPFMQTALAPNDKNKEQSTYFQSMNLQSPGIEAMKVELGTEPTPQKRKSFKKRWFAQSADQILLPNHRRRDFVRTIVSHSLDARAALMISIERVVSALRLSKLIDMRQQKHVRLVAVENLPNQSVFALRIKRVGFYVTGEFYSGNCDANRYITLATYTGDHRKAPQVVSNSSREKLSMQERMHRIRTPKRANQGW